MKRVALSFVALIVLVGVIGSMAAMHSTSSPADQSLAGKAVIVVAKGMDLGISENTRFESSGQHDYIVVPMQVSGTEATYDFWLSLDEVIALRVFDSMEEAVASDHRHERREAGPQATAESPEASGGPVGRGDVPEKVVKYAVAFIKRYDTNNDGVLIEDEWKKMNAEYSSADMDKDGRITPLELGEAFTRRDGGSFPPQTVAAQGGTDTLHDAKLVWQECKTESFGFGTHSIHRSRVPGGWLVVLQSPYPENSPSFTFYPDPRHEWDGTSID